MELDLATRRSPEPAGYPARGEYDRAAATPVAGATRQDTALLICTNTGHQRVVRVRMNIKYVRQHVHSDGPRIKGVGGRHYFGGNPPDCEISCALDRLRK